ncbi:MAG: thioredoxin family protein [Candidatus Peregrinibacteria bacterium]|nr:thioredoxin family protein [Candidatus Peregrinibacteria bacterium]
MRIHALPLVGVSFLLLTGCEYLQQSNGETEPETIIIDLEGSSSSVASSVESADSSSSVTSTAAQEQSVSSAGASVTPAASSKSSRTEAGVEAEVKAETTLTVTNEGRDRQAQETSQAAVAKGVYTAYADGVIGNGKKSVLFFHAGWCPICKSAEADLKQWYSEEGFPLTTYKVDYDAETELKTKYGVTYQHTFVVIDGQGNVVQKLQGPSDAELQALLNS